jgi:ribosomal protein S18 acetylase RimI-like enzyme
LALTEVTATARYGHAVDEYELRDASAADAPVLAQMLRWAMGWREVPAADGSPPSVPVAGYVFGDFGRPGDGGVIAAREGEPAGACWYRLLPAAARGHGFVAEGVPELTIAVLPIHRAQGLGGKLLDRALDHARAAGFGSIGLSVETDNPARGMYERRGFELVADNGSSWTMRKRLV